MKIISHRGYWKAPSEKNTEAAFDRSFSLGYGTETDIRDHCQSLVIAHDMPSGHEIAFADVLTKAARATVAPPLTLALNIKADGLAQSVASHLKQFPALDCFVFDMSVPDIPSYFAAGVPVFTRMSEVERQPAWLNEAAGVWLDAFASEWYETKDIEKLLALGKRVCVVSPELHRRDHRLLWQRLVPIAGARSLILCTDLPEDASEFFNAHGSPK